MWFFICPFIAYGDGALDYLDQIPKTKVFIVTDKVMRELGFIEKLEKKLKNIPYEIFDEVEPNPSLQTVEKGAKLCQEFTPDLIIGLGGGSVMDAGKGIWFLYEKPDQKVDSLNPFVYYENFPQKSKYVTIPTTSGTGADVTWGLVLTDTSQNRKLTPVSRQIVPSIAIIDPFFALEMPPALTAATGLDALTHSIECYLSMWRNDFSDANSIKAIEFIFKYLPRAFKDGNDKEAREKMHNAATIAGLSLGNSQATFAHSIGHSIGALFHKPHGACVGMALPYVMEFSRNNGSGVVELLADIGRRALLMTGTDDEITEQLILKVRDLIKEIKAPSMIPEMGISKSEFDENLKTLIKYTSGDSSISMTNPMPSDEQIEKTYHYMWEGKRIDF
ncbi:MAG: iron-containing alcohol dehydrogenase [Candidatus Helarchaeota archaeon]|nr:iron-containing alcohol dehydrogenase [Candidatus Helarchaeota archaeon]